MSHNVQEFSIRNKIILDEAKNIFLTTPDLESLISVHESMKKVYPPEKLFLEIFSNEETPQKMKNFGKYLAKIHSGKEYFDDYDCFVGNYCEKRIKIICGLSATVLSLQFERTPCTIKKKIKIIKGNKLTASFVRRFVDFALFVLFRFGAGKSFALFVTTKAKKSAPKNRSVQKKQRQSIRRLRRVLIFADILNL